MEKVLLMLTIFTIIIIILWASPPQWYSTQNYIPPPTTTLTLIQKDPNITKAKELITRGGVAKKMRYRAIYETL